MTTEDEKAALAKIGPIVSIDDAGHNFIIRDLESGERREMEVGEVYRCLSCGRAVWLGSDGDLEDCGGPFAVYSYDRTEDELGNEIHSEWKP